MVRFDLVWHRSKFRYLQKISKGYKIVVLTSKSGIPDHFMVMIPPPSEMQVNFESKVGIRSRRKPSEIYTYFTLKREY